MSVMYSSRFIYFGAVVAFLALLWISQPLLNAQQLSEESLHHRIMEASGFEHALSDIWLSIEQSIGQTNVSPSQRATLNEWLGGAFGGEGLTENFKERLREHLDLHLGAEVIRFLDSDPGRIILETEAAQVHATEDELFDFSQSFEPGSRQNRRRVELTRQILDGTRTLDNTVIILHSIYSNVMRAVHSVQAPEDRRMSEEDFAYTSGLIRTQLENQMSEYVMLNMLYTYRDIDISYLESYAAYLSSPAGLWYTETLHNILQNVLVDSENRLKAAIDQYNG
ncbi:MAG: hypothetical protein LAT75_15355 [Candidatus Cyclonatronum sp.]|uniref:hypothetical protein n=1 Tax=Cyclonatronum sp. TaxID=3024185 RepID=UPI0025BAC85F|nr:hypothetical protein [Cyclonatronum sp.]MCC5934089.1 hypothetical protein [Balneolales bacterium]MCH8488238.1 hypothetical protein [Cyclonatronum sp.]